MKVQLENWSLVLVGAWNTAILTPDWLTKQVDATGPVQIELPIGNPMMPLRYTLSGVHLVPMRDRVVLMPSSNEDAVLTGLEMFARKILAALAHTPVSAVGINFEFIENTPSDDLKSLFETADRDRIAAADFVVSATEIKRQLRLGSDGVVNFSLTRHESSDVVVGFNFHRDVDGAATAAGYLENVVLKYKERALRFLKEAYDLELGD